MKVYIPTPLRSYTKQSAVQAEGATLAEMFADLERHYPGIRFRVINEQDALREHLKIFVNGKIVEGLATPLQPGDDVHIVAAISGGA